MNYTRRKLTRWTASLLVLAGYAFVLGLFASMGWMLGTGAWR